LESASGSELALVSVWESALVLELVLALAMVGCHSL
jgi:hypothetical protein